MAWFTIDQMHVIHESYILLTQFIHPLFKLNSQFLITLHLKKTNLQNKLFLKRHFKIYCYDHYEAKCRVDIVISFLVDLIVLT